ncbi:GapA-binding peptide SR1P [Paenibacillus sp. J5C_2022]|uniref:GapA-binding peptide SR1P n=1 Tax=Paenibacillus sp. J5C2022 TaxID=2977129 RepID=UPI0021CEED03|nr:GapA-binding peptide SR1P [Paenibacillus sp. J5C2022]MCU6707387.1 GapA-binding peptide SR1P [Paenibacillus sp. J5C2022]
MTDKGLDLGVIICKHCMTVIDTLPTERVMRYYSDCQELDCLMARVKEEQTSYAASTHMLAASRQS